MQISVASTQRRFAQVWRRRNSDVDRADQLRHPALPYPILAAKREAPDQLVWLVFATIKPGYWLLDR